MFFLRSFAYRFFLINFIFVTSGCAVGRTDFVKLNAETSYAAIPSDHDVYITTMGIDGAFDEIGFIHVSGTSREGYEKLNGKIRAMARNAGADTVIYVTYGTENAGSIIPFFFSFPYDVLTAEGLAVHRKKR